MCFGLDRKMNVVIERRMKDIYIYIYIYVCVCVCDILLIGKSKLIIIKFDEQVVQDKKYT